LKGRLEQGLIRLISRIIARVFGQPRLAYHIPFNIRHLNEIFVELINQLCYLMGLPVSYRLRSIMVEPTNVCNLQCLPCPVNQGLKRQKGFMDLNLFQRLIDDTPWLNFIHLTFAGEPLLHPDILEMISYAKARDIRIGLVTNATLLNRTKSYQLIESGLDVITFSIDGTGPTYERIRGRDYDQIEEKVLNFIRLNEELGSPVRTEVSMVLFSETQGSIGPFLDRWQGRVDWVNIQPQIGYNRTIRKRACRNLWRTVSVYWDGRVVPCCVDYEGAFILGDIRKDPLTKIFNGTPMRRLRKKHLKGQFESICKYCNPFFG